ncbi:hypothetical protein [Paenibacillus sacheonensis]|uniref:Uncharacterized protein n=1 Tax=Paenibacillus sacheonensis TaxID=742054 RepID=A0A7X4YV52_9BACL|nr:hypothetical protein [Paenibacillus sacheonensis]MBM7566608.1 hypothetical protein [Paenibacillus sacheonensis]NBC73107.1 hypothetical protein [Paenibacillus sacheonensis]
MPIALRSEKRNRLWRGKTMQAWRDLVSELADRAATGKTRRDGVTW